MILSTIDVAGPCPCQSGRSYQLCCAMVHRDLRHAVTPEQLMRARYCAFVLHNGDFIVKSWATETRPKHFQFNFTTRWISLEVIDADPVHPSTVEATVTFTACFINNKHITTLHEQSQFIKRSKCWLYLDGRTQFSQQHLAGNAKCPCGSGKKFKRCCI